MLHFVQVIRGPAIFLALTLYKGGVFFLAFFFWSWLLVASVASVAFVASVASVASWLLWLLRSWLLVAPMAPGGSWWLLWLLVAPGGFCGF